MYTYREPDFRLSHGEASKLLEEPTAVLSLQQAVQESLLRLGTVTLSMYPDGCPLDPKAIQYLRSSLQSVLTGGVSYLDVTDQGADGLRISVTAETLGKPSAFCSALMMYGTTLKQKGVAELTEHQTAEDWRRHLRSSRESLRVHRKINQQNYLTGPEIASRVLGQSGEYALLLLIQSLLRKFDIPPSRFDVLRSGMNWHIPLTDDHRFVGNGHYTHFLQERGRHYSPSSSQEYDLIARYQRPGSTYYYLLDATTSYGNFLNKLEEQTDDFANLRKALIWQWQTKAIDRKAAKVHAVFSNNRNYTESLGKKDMEGCFAVHLPLRPKVIDLAAMTLEDMGYAKMAKYLLLEHE